MGRNPDSQTQTCLFRQTPSRTLVRPARPHIDLAPAVIVHNGRRATNRFFEFFSANIRNRNTREAYYRAALRFFGWCDHRNASLEKIEPILVAAYVEEMTRQYSRATAKQHLAAIRMLFDWLVVGQILPFNPALSVRGPRHVMKRGKTPALSSEQARALLDSVDTSNVVGLRDRALIAVMVYAFARVSAALGMRVCDYYPRGKRYWIRLHEKGGKFHEVPAHCTAEAYMDTYIHAAGISAEPDSPLFRTTVGKTKRLTSRRLARRDALRMIRRRALAAGLSNRVCCHTFRATGITAYLEAGGTIEKAQVIAGHESPRTTKLYDRTGDDVSLDEIERIRI